MKAILGVPGNHQCADCSATTGGCILWVWSCGILINVLSDRGCSLHPSWGVGVKCSPLTWFWCQIHHPTSSPSFLYALADVLPTPPAHTHTHTPHTHTHTTHTHTHTHTPHTQHTHTYRCGVGQHQPWYCVVHHVLWSPQRLGSARIKGPVIKPGQVGQAYSGGECVWVCVLVYVGVLVLKQFTCVLR